MVTATRMVVDTEIQLRVLKLAHCALGKLRLQTYRRNAVDTSHGGGYSLAWFDGGVGFCYLSSDE
jgi:hypothetical protein